jgi:MarR family transcriptional regulator, organic hydroperoxide resistance regulator
MNFNETIPFLFAQISTYFKVEIEKQLNEFELHGGQIFILFELWQTDGLSQIKLSKKLGVSPPTVNKMIKSLKTNGFVVTKNSSEDGRIMQVFLTQKAIAIRLTVEEQWKKIEEKLVANLTVTEQLVLSQLFGKISENFTAGKS